MASAEGSVAAAQRAAAEYAAALNGLDLPDPVNAFFDFCRAREAARLSREAGAPPPWTADPVLQRGRFLNVFREDDRGTKAALRFVTGLDPNKELERLVHALFFARWCNRSETLDALGSAAALQDPDALEKTLDELRALPWCNYTAYPVGDIEWRGGGSTLLPPERFARRKAATHLLGRAAPFLVRCIAGAAGDVTRATAAINDEFRMPNDFPIFMAVADLAWFRPDLIHPDSAVPVGMGALAFLDRLAAALGTTALGHDATMRAVIAEQPHRWPQAKRALQPIDVEYLACECRKYYSYINGTKEFVGKNSFVPGRTATLIFDEAAAMAQPAAFAPICVVAGGPCCGKSTLCTALREAGHYVEPETAEVLISAAIAAGKTAAVVRADPVAWQMELLHRDFALFDRLGRSTSPVWTDTSFIETVVFAHRAGITMGPGIESWLRKRRYRVVFFLESLDNKSYKETAVRMETVDLAEQIAKEEREMYERYGYEVVSVPVMPVQARLEFVLARAVAAIALPSKM